jgi:hypothetical protein
LRRHGRRARRYQLSSRLAPALSGASRRPRSQIETQSAGLNCIADRHAVRDWPRFGQVSEPSLRNVSQPACLLRVPLARRNAQWPASRNAFKSESLPAHFWSLLRRRHFPKHRRLGRRRSAHRTMIEGCGGSQACSVSPVWQVLCAVATGTTVLTQHAESEVTVRKAALRALVCLLATLGTVTIAAAEPRLRLAQSQAFSACMMTCSAVYMTCQQNCTPPGSRITASGADTSSASQCPLNCTSQQQVCQQNCAGR